MLTNYSSTRTAKNTLTNISWISSSDRTLLALLLISAAAAIALGGIAQNTAAGAAILGAAILLTLIKHPELALAVLFNGVIVYFYLLCKLGVETSRITTSAFYLALVGTAILGFILTISRRRYNFHLSLTDILFICFFSYIFLNYFVFSEKHEAAYIKICYAPLLVVGPYFATILLSREKTIRNFFNYCVILAAILIIPSFYELLVNPTFENSARFSAYEFSSGVDNPILFGLTFGTLLIIVGTWILERDGLKAKHLVLVIPSTFLLVRAGSRGALLSFIITIVFYIVVFAKIRLKTKLLTVIILSMLFISAYHFIPQTTIDFYKSTFDYQYMPESSVSQRLTMWQQALHDFKSKPILGVGVGNSVWGGGFPHNIVLEVAAEFGLVGLFMLAAICFLSIQKAMTFINKTPRNDLKICMKISLLLFIYSFIEAQFSGYITNQTRLFISIGLISSLARMRAGSPGSQTLKKLAAAI